MSAAADPADTFSSQYLIHLAFVYTPLLR